MKSFPKISVCIPAYNAQNTIRTAIWSIINQLFTDFELLIYLDGCTDNTERIIDEFSDKRIKRIISKENLGIVHARNELVKNAKGKYLAWLDADDIAMVDRLSTQYDFLERNSSMVMVGTWVNVRGNRKINTVKWSTNQSLVNAWILFRNPLVQSSIMIRNTNGEIKYDNNFEYLEDYAFLSNVWRSGGQIGILPEVLCSYLEPPEKGLIDKYLKYDFVGKLEKIMKENYASIGVDLKGYELSLYREFLRSNEVVKKKDGLLIWQVLDKIETAIKEGNSMYKREYLWVLQIQYIRLAKICKELQLKIIFKILMQPWRTYAAWRNRPRYIKE